MSSLLGTLLLTTLVSNILLITAILSRKRVTNFNIYLLNLAAISILDAAISMSMTLATTISGSWPFPSDGAACRLHTATFVLIPVARLLLVVALAADRLIATSSPGSYPDKMSRSRTISVIAYTWTHALIFTLPLMIGSVKPKFFYNAEECASAIPPPLEYVVFSLGLCYVLPAIGAITFFLLMLRHYVTAKWKRVREFQQSRSGDDLSVIRRQHRMSQSEWEVASFVAILFLLWVVFHTAQTSLLYSSQLTNSTEIAYPWQIEVTSQWFSYVYSAIYPFVAFYLNRNLWLRLKSVCSRSKTLSKTRRARRAYRRQSRQTAASRQSVSTSQDGTARATPVLLATSTGLLLQTDTEPTDSAAEAAMRRLQCDVVRGQTPDKPIIPLHPDDSGIEDSPPAVRKGKKKRLRLPQLKTLPTLPSISGSVAQRSENYRVEDSQV